MKTFEKLWKIEKHPKYNEKWHKLENMQKRLRKAKET